MAIADPYQAKLREALVGAVEVKRLRQRRRAITRRVAFAAVVALALVATIVTVTLPDDRAEASIEVDVHDGSVFVRLLDLESRPDEIVGALRNAGINATVEPVPVGPSNVGRFVGSSSEQGQAADIVREPGSTFTSFSVPEGYDGLLRLSLGRAAAPGELWKAPSNATAKGEVLACRNIRGHTAAEVSRQLAGTPARLTWLAVPDGTLESGAELGAYADWLVIDALSPSEGVAVIELTRDGRWPFLTQPPPQVDPSCKGN